MLLIKLLQQLISTLNSQGTPGQVAAGIALGSALGLTPLLNLHNLVIAALAMVFNVAFPGFMLGWALFVPLGFVLDPLFDSIGQDILMALQLRPWWTEFYNMPVVPLTNFQNSIVMGSLVVWLVSVIPMYFLFQLLVARYRKHVYARLQRTRFFQAMKASKVYNWYLLFRPPT